MAPGLLGVDNASGPGSFKRISESWFEYEQAETEWFCGG